MLHVAKLRISIYVELLSMQHSHFAEIELKYKSTMQKIPQIQTLAQDSSLRTEMNSVFEETLLPVE